MSHLKYRILLKRNINNDEPVIIKIKHTTYKAEIT